MARPAFGAVNLLLAATVASALAAATAAPVAAQGTRPESHTVRSGDTLWDLARRYFGDPFLWPEIYRLNTMVVEDPHWIYPGEVLRLASGGGDVASVPTTDTPPPAPLAAGDAAGPGGVGGAGTPADSGEGWQRYFEARTGGPALLGQVPAMPYYALRRGEFHSSGFLTEGRNLPFGKLLGRVTPLQIAAASTRETATLYTEVLVRAPSGTAYQAGDSVLIVRLGEQMGNYGRAVIPTGMIRITEVSDGQSVGSVVAVYSEITDGQLLLPVEPFTSSGEARAVPVADGVRAQVLGVGGLSRQVLLSPQDIIFLDKGSQAGVARGDIFEIRSTAERRPDNATSVAEVMAQVQVVRVGERSATARVIGVTSPAIAAGAESRQVGRLPT
ncbi:MAG TPA: LysM domain-containing protein [Gemmatimonadales bacterium]|nr:LysM domain-containing protein [Gemmatimonadales bacterium]